MKSGNGTAALATLLLAACGGGVGSGPAIEARSQTISFGAAPALSLPGTAAVSASASSGLAVTFSSTTPGICTIGGSTVTAVAPGTCTIAADQAGNSTYAQAPQVIQNISVIFDPNQTISFGAAPALVLYGTATVSASASSGLPVTYSSTTPLVCSVISASGIVTDLTMGDCIIAANQAGNGLYNVAPQATQVLTVAAPSGTTVPGAPTGVAATAGNASNTVAVSASATDSGGLPITGYTATSTTSASITASSATLPIAVTCPSSCAGHAFTLHATNAIGGGPESAAADVITTYNVTETFFEPDTQPRDSIFIGQFTYNSTTRTVTNLRGILSESMTGNPIAYPGDNMTWLTLNNQLSSVQVTLGGVSGLLVTTFLNTNTNTLTTMPMFGGTDGWSPGTGSGLYYGSGGMPMAPNAGNAYARIFVNTDDPLAALTQAQIDKLAYADCAPGGMMMMTCMTGTTVAGYGYVGTMSGYPVSQVITKQ